ncbi:MAG: glycosyltransferase family 4 protein [Actinomycetes bacterium]
MPSLDDLRPLSADIVQAGRALRSDGWRTTWERAQLARARRVTPTVSGALDSNLNPFAPLGWRSDLKAIYRHFHLGARGVLTWSEPEVLRDTRRIAALAPGERNVHSGAGPHVLVVEEGHLRHVLATVEALRTWPDSRNLPVTVLRTDRSPESWGTLHSLAGVRVIGQPVGGRGLKPPEDLVGTDVVLVIRAGDLPLPGWAAGLLHQLQRPGVCRARCGSVVTVNTLGVLRGVARLALAEGSAGIPGTDESYGIRRIELANTAETDATAENSERVAIDSMVLRPPGAGPRSSDGKAVEPATTRHRPSVLVVALEVPRLDQDSGSQDIYWIARHAADLGYQVSFVPLRAESHDHPYFWALRRDGIRVFPAAGEQSDLACTIDVPLEDADCCVAVGYQAARLAADRASALGIDRPVLFVPLDLTHLAVRKFESLDTDLRLGATSSQLEQREFDAVRKCALTAVISPDEVAYLAECGFADRAFQLPMLRSAPDRSHVTPTGPEPRLVLVGGFLHPPNIVSADWFIDEVWPLIHTKAVTATVDIYGSNLPADRRLLWESTDGVRVVGRFQHEWEPYCGDTVALAPLLFGGGVKGKVVTALGHGAPVVGTSYAVQGLPPDVRKCITVADDAQSFARRVVDLWSDPNARQDARAAAVSAYDAHFCEAAGREAMRETLARVLATTAGGARSL